jgi:hypothetical protein
MRRNAPAPVPADLPDKLRVFRGCSRERVLGVAWTTDRQVAEGFARGHRGIPVPDPVVASGVIDRRQVFMTFDDRSESEIVLDPDGLRELNVCALSDRRPIESAKLDVAPAEAAS